MSIHLHPADLVAHTIRWLAIWTLVFLPRASPFPHSLFPCVLLTTEASQPTSKPARVYERPDGLLNPSRRRPPPHPRLAPPASNLRLPLIASCILSGTGIQGREGGRRG
ncbi:hypothetical protein GGR56DRAFT_641388 [Xylariaceae sp. FL0804]|nr:hypothetical protein GGR56DRAFT_641388 [Xylariaceae sp. FL0804]